MWTADGREVPGWFPHEGADFAQGIAGAAMGQIVTWKPETRDFDSRLVTHVMPLISTELRVASQSVECRVRVIPATRIIPLRRQGRAYGGPEACPPCATAAVFSVIGFRVLPLIYPKHSLLEASSNESYFNAARRDRAWATIG